MKEFIKIRFNFCNLINYKIFLINFYFSLKLNIYSHTKSFMMSSSEQSDAGYVSSSNNSKLTAEQKQKYEDFCNLYPAIRSITEAPPLEAGAYYVPNSALNPIVVDDEDEDDDNVHPPVILRPLDHSEDETPWDKPILHQNQQEDSLYDSSESSSSYSEETTTAYSTDGGFVVDGDKQHVFLHNHDPDFVPDNVSASDVSGGNEAGQDSDDVQNDDDDVGAYDKANAPQDEGTSDDEEPPTAKKIRRESADF